jgi:hypothetical protein
MPMAERCHSAVFEVLCLHSVVAVAGDIAAAGGVVVVAAGVAGPIPVEIVGAKVMLRANGGSRCLQIEAWQ